MVLRVQYHNDKFDYVNDFALGKLITMKEIKKILSPIRRKVGHSRRRCNERRWVVITPAPIDERIIRPDT